MRACPTLSVALACVIALSGCDEAALSQAERERAQTLSLSRLGPLPPDPSNQVADNPKAAEIGKRIFFDTGFSKNGAVACATCHLPDRQFQDDKPRAVALGTGVRRTMPLAGTAWGQWFFWDGRKDSAWSQALGPLEDEVEHGGNRLALARYVLAKYGSEYAAVFGPPPALPSEPLAASPRGSIEAREAWRAMGDADRLAVNRVFSNIGKAIAAYTRRLALPETRFDRYVATFDTSARNPAQQLNSQEITGLKLFLGRAQCTNCHEGPRLTDDHFHNTGVPAVAGLPEDRGRSAAIAILDADEFNCLGPFSDAPSGGCSELRFMSRNAHDLTRAFKPPSLRGVTDRAPYMHAGQLATLEDVIVHYDQAPRSPTGHTELKPLGLSAEERAALVAFLKTL